MRIFFRNWKETCAHGTISQIFYSVKPMIRKMTCLYKNIQLAFTHTYKNQSCKIEFLTRLSAHQGWLCLLPCLFLPKVSRQKTNLLIGRERHRCWEKLNPPFWNWKEIIAGLARNPWEIISILIYSERAVMIRWKKRICLFSWKISAVEPTHWHGEKRTLLTQCY